MDQLEFRLARIVHDINVTYKTNISIKLANKNLGYGSKFLGVTNQNLIRAYPQNAGMYTDLERWSDEQIIRQILAVLGLLDAVAVTETFKEKEKMSVYDDQTDLKEKAGKKTAEILLPFLNTKVPFASIHQLAILVAGWSGYGDSSSFTTGFMSVFFEYKDANKLLTESIKGPSPSQIGRTIQQEEI